MATFTNQATLSYNGGSIRSNVVTGELLDVLQVTKTATLPVYGCGSEIAYAISIVNSGTLPFTGLTVSDNLGQTTFGAGNVYPLEYIDGSMLYYVDGALQTAPAVTAGPPLSVAGVNVPAGGSAMLIYKARLTEYAPMAAGSSVVNQASVSGPDLPAPVTATETVSAEARPCLSVNKALSPSTVTQNGQLAYTFTIENYGNTAATAADLTAIADTFAPALNNVTVTFNGTAWTAGTEYTYTEADGQFATEPGRIVVPAASYTQNAATGAWTVAPGTAVLVVKGVL